MSKKNSARKIFVLDTSVILHDHEAINSFDEHDIAIPITVLEELDNFKKGNQTKNYEAREFIRTIDRLSGDHSLQDWIPLEGEGQGKFKIVMNTHGIKVDAEKVFDQKKADHKILNAALCLQMQEKGRKVIMVTKDVNLRIKAKSLDIPAQDYETGKIQDIKNLYTGKKSIENLESDIIRKIFNEGYIEDISFMDEHVVNNHFYILKNGKSSTLGFFNPVRNTLDRVEKSYTYGIKPRNAEQTFALHAILNPDIKIVTLQGVAGTGKTLLALAGSLEQRKRYKQIVLARPIVPLSNKDLGYLPGDVKEKITPYKWNLLL